MDLRSATLSEGLVEKFHLIGPADYNESHRALISSGSLSTRQGPGLNR